VDSIRKIGFLRFGLTAGLVGAAAYVAPAIWATDRMLFGVVSFDQVTFVLSLVLAYAALRIGDPYLRAKLAIGVIAAFVVAAAVLLAFSVESLVLVMLALAVGYFEWPHEAAEARTY
jgi:hypothetical protein